MRIRAMAVFERVVYHAVVVDPANPCTPMLEVDAVLRPGDADGPLLLSVAEYLAMAGSEAADRCLPDLRRRGRVADHLGVAHVTFPFWEPVDVTGPRPSDPA
jgi:hypothetical protein